MTPFAARKNVSAAVYREPASTTWIEPLPRMLDAGHESLLALSSVHVAFAAAGRSTNPFWKAIENWLGIWPLRKPASLPLALTRRCVPVFSFVGLKVTEPAGIGEPAANAGTSTHTTAMEQTNLIRVTARDARTWGNASCRSPTHPVRRGRRSDHRRLGRL